MGELNNQDKTKVICSRSTDSPRSASPQLDMERLLDDVIAAAASPSAAVASTASQNQMILLANQIIAAMPDRIKQSPARGLDESAVAMEVRIARGLVRMR